MWSILLNFTSSFGSIHCTAFFELFSKMSSETTKLYRIGDLKRNILTEPRSTLNEKSSTSYAKLMELFSSTEDSSIGSTQDKVPFLVESSHQIYQNKHLKIKKNKFATEEDESKSEQQTEEDEMLGKRTRFVNKKKPDENKRTVFVGNLPNTFTRKRLRKLFKTTGAIESIRIRSVARSDPTVRRKLALIRKDFHPDVGNMNAYVLFREENAAKAALELNGHEIEGFHLRVDMAESPKNSNYKKSVFLGNLGFKLDEEKVRRHFEDCGDIISVRIIRDKGTRMGKGFGYVQFKESVGMELALKLNKSMLEGRPLRVSRCERINKSEEKSTFKARGKLNNKIGNPQKSNKKLNSSAEFAKRRILTKSKRKPTVGNRY